MGFFANSEPEFYCFLSQSAGCLRVKPYTGANPERRNAPCLGLSENRYVRDSQDVGKFFGSKGMTSHCDLVSQR